MSVEQIEWRGVPKFIVSEANLEKEEQADAVGLFREITFEMHTNQMINIPNTIQ